MVFRDSGYGCQNVRTPKPQNAVTNRQDIRSS